MRQVLTRVLALFDGATRRRFYLATAGSVVLALAEVGAVILVLPLMQLILNQPSGDGLLLWLKRQFGFPSAGRLALYIAVIVFLGFLIKGVASLAIRWWTLGFVNRQGVRTAGELLDYYLHAPISLHVRRGTADLLRMLNEALSQVYGQIIGGAMGIITESITIVAMTVTLFLVAPLPTLAVVVYFGVAGYLMQRWVKRHAVQAGEDLIHHSYLTGQTALQALGGVKEIKLRNEQQVFVERYTGSRMRVAEAIRMTGFLNDLPKYALELLFILGIGIMTALVYAQEQSAAALGTLAIFAVAGFRVLPSTVRVLSSINVFRAGLPALQLVERDLEAARAMEHRPDPQVSRMPFRQSLVLDSVSFRYDDGTADVVQGVDLRVPLGSSLALVGGSGAGKSTLVDMVLGLRSPTAGRILVDEVDISGNLAAWQQNLAMVPQDVFLLDASLRDNIRFTPLAEDLDDSDLLARVVDQAQLGDLIAELPDGLDTHVGDRGTRLSGGQRQRVGIARALYRDPSLLVLDEATSALDNATERLITDTIASLSGDITVVVVAHRLSTVRHCDQLAYLEGGQVQAVGTFDEVRAASPGFDRLVRLGSLQDH